MRSVLSQSLYYILWPLLLGLCIAGTQVGLAFGHGVLGFNVVYLLLACALAVLERLLPHEKQWLLGDSQLKPDLAHTLLNKGMVQVIIVVSTVTGLAGRVGGVSTGLWPQQWPMFMQVVLGLVVMEFGLYWKHRLAHEKDWLWPFHAVHHSAPRLWFFNTGRFHVVDTVTGLLFGLPLLFALGAPNEVFSWVAAITAYVGMLTHCNVEMKFGWLSLVFNTPELHRWHHSRVLRESNKNYGENLTLWDHVFGTYFCAKERRPPANIGISHPMPSDFLGQLRAPFGLLAGRYKVTETV